MKTMNQPTVITLSTQRGVALFIAVDRAEFIGLSRYRRIDIQVIGIGEGKGESRFGRLEGPVYFLAVGRHLLLQRRRIEGGYPEYRQHHEDDQGEE